MSQGETDRTSQRSNLELRPQRTTGDRVYGEEQSEEQRNLRRLQVMMQFLLATIAQDRSMTVEEAAALVAHTRSAALRMFPGKETAFNLLCRPRIQRAMRERFQIQ